MRPPLLAAEASSARSIGRSPTVVDPHVAAVGPAQFLQPLQEGREASLFFGIVRGPAHEHADATHPVGLLRARSAWPGEGRDAKKGNEFAPPHGSLRTRIVQRPKRITLR